MWRMFMKASAAFRWTVAPRERASASKASIERSSGKDFTCDSKHRKASSLRSRVDEMSMKTLGRNAGVSGGAYQFVSESVS